MVVVGAFVRLEASRGAQVRAVLGAMEGVETFELDEPGKLGLVLEMESLDAAHGLLTGAVRHAEGVLGVWPVYASTEEEQWMDWEPGSPVDLADAPQRSA